MKRIWSVAHHTTEFCLAALDKLLWGVPLTQLDTFYKKETTYFSEQLLRAQPTTAHINSKVLTLLAHNKQFILQIYRKFNNNNEITELILTVLTNS